MEIIYTQGGIYMDDKDWIFKKLPNWLRWILALPVALIGSVVVPTLTRFCANWAYGNTNGVLLFDIAIMIVSAMGLLAGIYFCVPKYKNQITGIVSIILAIYFAVITTLFITRGYLYDRNTLTNVIASIASIYMSFVLLSSKEDVSNNVDISSNVNNWNTKNLK